MDQLLAALDALAAEDLTPLVGPALLDPLGPLLAAQNRLAAAIARTVRECEVSGTAEVDGLKSMGSWLRGHGHLSVAEAARVARTGRARSHPPGLAAAFDAGAVTGEGWHEQSPGLEVHGRTVVGGGRRRLVSRSPPDL